MTLTLQDEMPAHSDDRWLWVIVGSGLLIAANAIPYYLKYIRTLTEVNHDEDRDLGPAQDAGEALSLTTLEKLVAAPSYKLRSSAVKIIAQRSTKDATRKLLLQDLASKNPHHREQAIRALWFLLSHSGLKASPEITRHFTTDRTAFAAIIKCLANLLPLHENSPPVRADNPTASSPLLPHNRPPSETQTLLILHKLLTNQTATTIALSAGVVSKWLKYYPFPCTLPENGGRREQVVELFKKWGEDDPLMDSIMKIITNHAEGLKELRRHGLAGSSSGKTEVDTAGIKEVSMTNGEDTAGMPLLLLGAHSGSSFARRPQDPSTNQAERAVRQRRREATVYSEGNAPLTQDNIFQRQPSILGPAPETSPEIEAEFARTNEEIGRQEEELVEALEEVRDEGSTRPSEGWNSFRPSSFWQWLTMNSGQSPSPRRHPLLAGLESHRYRQGV